VSGINALSAPVFNAFGAITGVLTIVGSVCNLAAELNGPQARCLDQIARGLSAELGFREALADQGESEEYDTVKSCRILTTD